MLRYGCCQTSIRIRRGTVSEKIIRRLIFSMHDDMVVHLKKRSLAELIMLTSKPLEKALEVVKASFGCHIAFEKRGKSVIR